MLCDDLEDWDVGVVGRRLKKEGMYVYTYVFHFDVQQNRTQLCKAIIL